jgi:hypothetical protein
MSASDIKLKVIPLFPSQTTAGQAIRLDTKNTQYKFSLDYTSGINTAYAPDPADTLLLFNGSSYFRVPVSSVIPTIVTTPAVLTTTDVAPVGTVVGTLSVIGGTGSYIFSLTSNPGALYSIVGNQLEIAAPLISGIDPITIQAYNGIGQPHSLATTVMVTHVHVGYVPTYYIYGF